MFSFFFEVLFILTFLSFGFSVSQNVEAKSKVKFSKKYIPPGNPGGASFHEDEDFVESYKLYEKRREILKKKKSQSRTNPNLIGRNLVRRLREKKSAPLYNKSNEIKNCTINDGENAMINQHGIDIARLKGAVFIDDQPQYEEAHLKTKQQERKRSIAMLERKISPINITINGASSKKTCLCDSITNLNNLAQHNLNSSDVFESITDTTK
ncbi:MAG: TRP75-related protein [Wolbachia endosymbiont of Meromenopon meropis]|nr:TRP75-related protein [Wolbachia endosymbiont of Meromenopon meropis]